MRIEAKSGPGIFRTEQRTHEQTKQALERHILQQGGVKFELAHDVLETGSATVPDSVEKVSLHYGDKTKQSVAVLLEVVRPIEMPGDQGKNVKSTGTFPKAEAPYVEIAATDDPSLRGTRYQLNLSDAPKELRVAVLKKWADNESNAAVLAGHADVPANLLAEVAAIKQMYEPIIGAMKMTADVVQRAVKPAEVKLAPPKPVAEIPRAATTRSRAKESAPTVREQMVREGAVLYKGAAVQLNTNLEGRLFVSGLDDPARTSGVELGQTFAADMSDLPTGLRPIHRKESAPGYRAAVVDASTLPIDRRLTRREAMLSQDGILFKGAVIMLEQRGDRRWLVRDVDDPTGSSGIIRDQIFAQDFSDAPAGLSEAIPWLSNQGDWRRGPKRGAGGKFERQPDDIK